MLIFAVTALCSFSLSQCCAHFRCHSAVLVFAVTALCTSVSNRCRITPVYEFSSLRSKCKREGGGRGRLVSLLSSLPLPFFSPLPPPFPFPFALAEQATNFISFRTSVLREAFLKNHLKLAFCLGSLKW